MATQDGGPPLDSPYLGPALVRQARISTHSGRPEGRPVRVLLTGEACLKYAFDLEDGPINIIGYAESVGEAARLLHALRPDVVLLEPHSTDDMQLLSSYVPVVVPASAPGETPEGEDPAGRDVELGLMQIALALASAMPSRRLICLNGRKED